MILVSRRSASADTVMLDRSRHHRALARPTASSSAETTQAEARRKVYMSSFRGGRAARRGQAMRMPMNTGRKGVGFVVWERGGAAEGEVDGLDEEGEDIVGYARVEEVVSGGGGGS